MNPEIIALLSTLVLVVMLFVGIPIFITMFLISFVGTWMIAGYPVAIGMITTTPFVKTSNYAFTALPMFILMGAFATQSGIAQEAYRVAVIWLGRLRGGLAMATTAGCALFGACSGSSIATTAIFTRISLPEMLSKNYAPSVATASIATAGTLAVMIPPSGMMIVYSFITDVSLGKLLMAGVLPGVALAFLFCATIYIQVVINPKLAPISPTRSTWREKVSSLRLLSGIALIVALLVGGLYTGVFTPTEGGAIGALITLVIGLARRKLTRPNVLLQSLVDAAMTTGLIFAIIIASLLFGRFFAFIGFTDQVAEFLTSLPLSPTLIVLLIMLMYFVLGMFMDEVAMVSLTLPIIFPAMQTLGVDGVWFGVLVVLSTQMGMIAPPVGITVFTVKALAGDSVKIGDIYRGVIPFLIATWVMAGLLLAFPGIALWLPSQLF